MKVVKFFTYKIAVTEATRVIWYLKDNIKRSTIIERVERYLRQNCLTCLMDSVKLYHDKSLFDKEEKLPENERGLIPFSLGCKSVEWIHLYSE